MEFLDYSAEFGCLNLEESYGEICVKCNKCGRWNWQIEQERKTETEQQ
jgi:hypothetical protein